MDKITCILYPNRKMRIKQNIKLNSVGNYTNLKALKDMISYGYQFQFLRYPEMTDISEEIMTKIDKTPVKEERKPETRGRKKGTKNQVFRKRGSYIFDIFKHQRREPIEIKFRRPPIEKLRNCLNCSHPFRSEAISHRICEICAVRPERTWNDRVSKPSIN